MTHFRTGPRNRHHGFLAATLGLLALLAACRYERSVYPPPDPDSGWIWSGAVTTESARVRARLPTGATESLLVGREEDLEEGILVPPTAVSPRRVATWDLAGLEPESRYFYAVKDAEGSTVLRGRFETFGEGPRSFSFAVASCAATGSRHPVFDAIRKREPAFFLHLGDFHYENIRWPRPEAYRNAYEMVLESPVQAALYREVPIVYVWDDHDFGGNDTDRANPGRKAARLVYQELVPHYPLVAGEGDVPIHQAFTVGRVRFLVTDSRSERSPASVPDGPGKSVLGKAQRAWLERELWTAGDRHALVVLVTGLPWIAPERAYADHWGGYATERRQLARLIADPAVPPVVLLAGDAHMLALDDGTHNTYGGGRGFPVFQAAALDQWGSVKGGPYSHGAHPGGGQYGWIEVQDDGEGIVVIFTGYDAEGRRILRYRHEIPAP